MVHWRTCKWAQPKKKCRDCNWHENWAEGFTHLSWFTSQDVPVVCPNSHLAWSPTAVPEQTSGCYCCGNATTSGHDSLDLGQHARSKSHQNYRFWSQIQPQEHWHCHQQSPHHWAAMHRIKGSQVGIIWRPTDASTHIIQVRDGSKRKTKTARAMDFRHSQDCQWLQNVG